MRSAAATVTKAKDELIALSHSIHSEPELAFHETRSAAKITELAANHGFQVERGVGGLPTAFTASYGSGDLVIGICAEYDALPEIGHACGHNIIAAAGLGAAIGLADVADDLGITVRLIGTPAEESGGGKVLLLERGIFDDVAAALMVHPGPFDIVGASSLALADIAIEFTGREAHASAAPEFGRNAADAVTVAQVALGLLRQHLAPGQQLHGIVTDGGVAPNIIPGRSELHYYLRANTAGSLNELFERASACFAAGALATGCTHDVRTVSPTYTELTPDPTLVRLYRDEVVALGRAPDAPRLEQSRPLGSTDMGNVTNVVPGIHPVIGIDSEGSVAHNPGFAKASVNASADKAVLDGAIALANTAIRVASDDTERARLLELHARRLRRDGRPQ
ncbi:M20 family metallopeptidase [Skermania sp. ID1734]|uniref:M20 family metallopeptidase n=1 Tax=Skermania sp. ID1734 TaxID=2597516 RepID=UPI00117FA49C|nr:M20 family metallopeptidase [Skermania sp. ID1734]TSE02031.1 M20 family metallopeptidase [Skermania sp. ID1734]